MENTLYLACFQNQQAFLLQGCSNAVSQAETPQAPFLCHQAVLSPSNPWRSTCASSHGTECAVAPLLQEDAASVTAMCGLFSYLFHPRLFLYCLLGTVSSSAYLLHAEGYLSLGSICFSFAAKALHDLPGFLILQASFSK